VFREYRRVQGSVAKENAAGVGLNSQPMGVNNIAGAYSQVNEAIRVVNMFTRAGMIHFSDNQCKLNPRNEAVTIALSSILIFGLADEGFHDNQCSCNIPRSLLITNSALIGGTTRATGNWWKETFLHVGFSAMTFGFLNATTDNESVHCLKVTGVQRLDRHNLVLGAILMGVTGDIAEEETRKKLQEVCRGNSIGRILVQMYVAILRGQDDTDTNKAVGSFIKMPGGGG
jgi:hypothetical protein